MGAGAVPVAGGAAPAGAASVALTGTAGPDLLQPLDDHPVAGAQVRRRPATGRRPCCATCTGRTATLPSAPTTIADRVALRDRARSPCCGTSSASWRTPLPTTARTYMPGSRTSSGLGTTTRSRKLPVPGSTVTSVKVSLPSCWVAAAVLEQDRHRQVARLLQAARRELPAQLEQLGARLRDVDVDRDRAAGPWPARSAWLAVTSAPCVTDDLPMRPGDGRGDPRVREDDVGAVEDRLRGDDVGLRLPQRGDRVLVVLLADVPRSSTSSAQRRGLRPGRVERRLRAHERGPGGRLRRRGRSRRRAGRAAGRP